jgi:hypothetical protein
MKKIKITFVFLVCLLFFSVTIALDAVTNVVNPIAYLSREDFLAAE